MSAALIVYKNRTNYVQVSMGIDVSADTFSSQIRSKDDATSQLIATWTVTKPNGGTDGLLLLALDDAITSAIAATRGYMDLKRISAGEPLPVFDRPVEVIFQGAVTQ